MLVTSILLALVPQIWLVDASGSGDFTDLQAAVDAATPGDWLHVAPGTYPGPVLVTKELTIHGLGPSVRVDGRLRVEAAGAATLSFLQADGFSLVGIPGPARVRNCTGMGWTDAHLSVTGCPDVLVSESRFYHLPSFGGPPGLAGGAGVVVSDSGLSLIDCDVRSGDEPWAAQAGVQASGVVELALHATSVGAGHDTSGAWPPDLAPAIQGPGASGQLDVLITGDASDLLLPSFLGPRIAGASSVAWSGISPVGMDPLDEEVPMRPFLNVEDAGLPGWGAFVRGPVGTTGLIFASVIPQVWSDPLIGGSDLYFAPTGVVDIRAFYLSPSPEAVISYAEPVWASAYPGFTVGIQAVTFSGPTGLEATNPDWIVFD